MRAKLEMSPSDYKKYFFKDFKNIELRSCGVYGIRNKSTNQTYIGSTGETFKQRWTQHIEDLYYKIHNNFLLLEAWNDYSFEDFEFFILKSINYECDREHIYRIEQKYIDNYLINNRKLFNIILTTRNDIRDKKYLNITAKEKLKELLIPICERASLSDDEIEEILDYDINTIENIMESLDGIKPMVYEGLTLYVSQNITNRGVARWKYDTLDISDCSIIDCPYYDRSNYYCKKYDEHMSETWYKPTWCSQFQDSYIISAKMMEEKLNSTNMR